MIKTIGLTLLLISSQVMAGSEICIDKAKDTITVSSHYYFYGNYAKSIYTRPCVAEINRMFNSSHMMKLRGTDTWRKVIFKVTGSIVSPSQAADLMRHHSTDTRYNFVRIEKHGKASISMHSLNGNSGVFKTGDGLGLSTTCAHEYGHGLGIDHPTKAEFSGKGVPPLMAARGAIVERKYQYNPLARPGTSGGTVNPLHRRLNSEELSRANFGALDFRPAGPNKECAQQGREAVTYGEDNTVKDWWDF